jgi:phage tail-like protein
MTIAAIGSLAASAMSAASAGQQLDPPMGLAFRFTVKIGSLELGSWQSCTGLKMDFAPLAVKAGGHYNGVQYLAGEITYPKVVLTRPVVARDSALLQSWLKSQGTQWVDGTSATGDDAVVTLYDSYQSPVMSWKLSYARPASWSGPNLDAGSSKVATETLELVHGGFEVTTPGGTAPSAGTPAAGQTAATPASAPTLSGPGGTVTFKFPPTDMAVTRTSEQPRQVVAADLAGAPEATQDTTSYVLNNLYLDGTTVPDDVGKLTAWATKTSRELQRDKGKAKLVPSLPWLNYTWGSALPYVQLSYLSVTYVRFGATGTPTRAKVNIKLTERRGSTPAGDRNPTSAGVAGREARVVVAGDTLPHLAEEKYGAPERWREIAEANGLDDPLRLRPGRSVYLPAPSEATSGANGAANGVAR